MGKQGLSLFLPSRFCFAILRKCVIVRYSCRAATPSKSRVKISVRGRAVTPVVYCSNYSVEQCLTMYCRSLNEVLDLHGVYYKCRVV
jgi:hypothetical protein